MADKKIEAELMGACKFCGQTTLLPDPKEWEWESAEEEATMKCTCLEGQHYRSRQFDLKTAEENIELLFTKFPDETRKFIKKAAIAVEDGQIEKAVFKLSDEVTATVKLKNSHLAIERKKLEVTELETM